MPSRSDISSDASATRLTIASDPTAVRDALVFLASRPPLCDLSEAERGNAELVLAEALNNVVEHAYAMTSGMIEVTVNSGAAGIICWIEDRGSAMPERKLPAGNLPKCMETATDGLPEGGFGWFLIRTLTLDLTYERIGSRNRLSFILPPAAD